MRCQFLSDGKGGTVIACGGRRPAQRCQVSGCKRASEKQCDFPTLGGGTCDLYLCKLHALVAGDNVDYCPSHARRLAASEAEMLAALDGEG